jgi:hypothetical protein
VAQPSQQRSYFFPHSGNKYDRKASRGRLVLRIPSVALALAAIAAVCLLWTAQASAGPPTPRLAFTTGEIVPIPAAIPHEEGDMVDRRIVPNLRWISARFPIYVTDGYSGRLPNGEHAGCRGCHVRNSDHYNGLAVDIVALNGRGGCDRAWRGITRLARWAEPRQNRPAPPFRWVGYNGDSGHGCGHHLHLSWQHAEVRMFQLAEWVEVFPVKPQGVSDHPRRKRIKPRGAAKPAPSGPPGGVATIHSGGVSARGD